MKPWAGRAVHLVGIGGAGMSGWARVAVQLGATVTGSERAESPALGKLRALGVRIEVGGDQRAAPAGADVFHSTAIPEAQRPPGSRPRADLLRELTSMKRVIAFAGAHGKTTTTSMAAHALLGAGLEPGYLIGGALRSTGEHADWGAGEWLVVEADESDRSMLALDVDVAVVLNVEPDHGYSLAEVRAIYAEFLAAAPTTLTHWPQPRALDLRDGGSRFGWREHEVVLQVPGAHNASNAIAALEACLHTGADPAALAGALASFSGAGRRFERLGTTPEGAVVVDDYAHHPTEVAATIAAARTHDAERVIAVFQPHLYSRTREFAAEFTAALAGADLAFVLDVYPARERAEDFPGVSGATIAGATFVASFDDARAALAGVLRPGDLVLCMGAGDVDALARSLVAPRR